MLVNWSDRLSKSLQPDSSSSRHRCWPCKMRSFLRRSWSVWLCLLPCSYTRNARYAGVQATSGLQIAWRVWKNMDNDQGGTRGTIGQCALFSYVEEGMGNGGKKSKPLFVYSL